MLYLYLDSYPNSKHWMLVLVLLANPTVSPKWGSWAHSEFVRLACIHGPIQCLLACVHHGQMSNRTPSFEWARRAPSIFLRLISICVSATKRPRFLLFYNFVLISKVAFLKIIYSYFTTVYKFRLEEIEKK